MQIFRKEIQKLTDKLTDKGLNDPRMLGLVLLAVIGLSVVWNGARVVQQNYTLLQKIAVLEEENRILEIENSNKKIQIEYYKTPEFAELKARKVNGKAASGEKVYIVTDEVALANLKVLESTEIEAAKDINKPKYQQNFESWVDFFFGNNN